ILNAVKILHISTADNGGGASRSAYRLHDGLRRSGEASRMYVLDKYTSDPQVRQFHSSRGRIEWIARNTRRLRLNLAHRRYAKTSPAERTFFSEDRTPFYVDACRQMPEAELINLHWVAGFLDLGAFFGWLPGSMPLVWTLHDMASFTGGCCHAMGCDRFTQQCGACPQLGSTDEGDLTREVWRRKQKYYAALDPSKFHIVTPSGWLGEEVKRSPLMSRFDRSVIPYGLDLEVFQARDRRFSREVLGIPQDAKVILFVSNGLHVHLKGFKHLIGAMEEMDAASGIFLLCLGFGAPPELERFPHAHITSMSDDRALSMVYSAADVFVLPSLANDTKRAEMSANCRRVALAEYDLSVQTGRYVRLYTEMLGQGAGEAGKEAAVHSAAAS